jgi:hypothetical protein
MATHGFAQGHVSVDNDFARFGSKSYAINKINSVEVRSERMGSDLPWIICGAIAAICGFAFLGDPNPGSLIGGLIFGGLAYLLFKSAQRYNHKLYLMTSSSEVQALQSQDKSEIDQLRNAIEAAMVANK